jgi:hypothetical protein
MGERLATSDLQFFKRARYRNSRYRNFRFYSVTGLTQVTQEITPTDHSDFLRLLHRSPLGHGLLLSDLGDYSDRSQRLPQITPPRPITATSSDYSTAVTAYYSVTYSGYSTDYSDRSLRATGTYSGWVPAYYSVTAYYAVTYSALFQLL